MFVCAFERTLGRSKDIAWKYILGNVHTCGCNRIDTSLCIQYFIRLHNTDVCKTQTPYSCNIATLFRVCVFLLFAIFIRLMGKGYISACEQGSNRRRWCVGGSPLAAARHQPANEPHLNGKHRFIYLLLNMTTVRWHCSTTNVTNGWLRTFVWSIVFFSVYGSSLVNKSGQSCDNVVNIVDLFYVCWIDTYLFVFHKMNCNTWILNIINLGATTILQQCFPKVNLSFWLIADPIRIIIRKHVHLG